MKSNADQPKAPELKPNMKDDLKSLPLPELQAKLESSPEGLSPDISHYFREILVMSVKAESYSNFCGM